MDDWLTTVLIALPLVAGLAVWLLPWSNRAAASFALLAALVEVGVWINAVTRFNFDGGLQLDQQREWFGDLGVSYHVGLYGFSLWLVGMSVVVMAAAIAYAFWVGRERPRAYFGLMLFLTGAVVGVFSSQDLLVFYVFFEAMLIPLYVLVGVWGGPGRMGATIKFVIYTMAGSLLMLAAIIVYGLSEGTFDLVEGGTSTNEWAFLGFAAAFAVKAPLFPLHGWLPDAYRESSPEVAAVLSGVVSKAAGYGFLAIAIAKFPEPARDLQPLLLGLAATGLVYGSFLAFRAPDVRGVIAYSSLAQMSLITIGLFALNDLGLNGSVLHMVNHGLLSAALFLLAGAIERRTATGDLDRLGGMARGRPALATVLMTVGVIALAVPGSSAFAGEFLILAGVFSAGWAWAAVGAFAIVLAAMYTLRLISAVLHRDVGPAVADEALDLRPAELAIVVPLVACLLALSVWPAGITDHISFP
ncbi:MAG: NADH-quinone oxidoreductase subunit M [Actinobacteria bacterium]|nr:NADH-quinone oxidoreductase subunit M [Actinomycetota bacterium]